MEKTPSGRTDPASSGRPCEPRLDARKLRELESQFTYHTPTLAQVQAMSEIRQKAKELAILVALNAPVSADTSAAIRKIREAVMSANAAIVLEGRAEAIPTMGSDPAVPSQGLGSGGDLVDHALAAKACRTCGGSARVLPCSSCGGIPRGWKSFVCGVDCFPDSSSCNSYCVGGAPAPKLGAR